MIETSESASQKAIRITFVTAFYMVVSISLVFLNKLILQNGSFDFPFPLFVTWFQLLVSEAIMLGLGVSGKYIHTAFRFAPLEFHLSTAKKVAPLTIIYIGMLSFNNMCLKYVSVFYYQVARSLTIIFNILFTYLVLHTKTNTITLVSCAVVFMGFLLGAQGETNFSLVGTFLGVMSSICVALYSIFVKRILAKVDYDEWLLLSYNTILAIVGLLVVIVVTGEASDALQVDFLLNPLFALINVGTGVIGFLINVAVFLVIKHTSPLSNNIAGTVKACIQSALSIVLFNIELSFLSMLGILLVIGGSAWYSFIRYSEMKKRQEAEKSARNSRIGEVSSLTEDLESVDGPDDEDDEDLIDLEALSKESDVEVDDA